jgi:hypothetical protein
MRQRLHYTPSQITKNLYTTGSEWMTDDQREYIGPYHTYITGEVFTETEWVPTKSKKLVALVIESDATKKYKELKTVQTSFKTPNTFIPVVTEADRKAGFITRYFLKKVNQQQIIEVDSTQYTSWQTREIDNNIYSGVQIKWTITGPMQDTFQNGVLTKGVVTKNIEAMRTVETKFPEIFDVLTNPIQYYSDTDFLVPNYINE